MSAPRTERHAAIELLDQREALARCQGMHRVFYGNAFERHSPLRRTRPSRLRLIGRQLLRYLLSPRAFGRR